jgi:von Willebrand factor type A domain
VTEGKTMVRRLIYLCCAILVVVFAAKPQAQEGRSIALILDASGSMNAKLAAGGTRIEAAKAAVAAFVAKLDPNTRISYRVYGHQSPTKAHNCKDTELLVSFGPASANRDAILAKTQSVKAQGYTPITYVIQLAAADIAKEPGARTIVLVSDGKETCAGDPCAAAKALAAADTGLVIHTIGFNVDAAARFQLQCIARVARGTYSDATGAADLGARLGAAAAAKPEPPPVKVTTKQTTIQLNRPGKLEIKQADLRGHTVTEAESGKEVARLNTTGRIADLPPGIYNVSFGPTVWRSIEVRPGETTLIDPGILEVHTAWIRGHKVLDWETEAEIATFSTSMRRISVVPSTFTVTFGNARWENIDVKAGEHKIINPAVIIVKGLDHRGGKVNAADGTFIANVTTSAALLPVPPGKYLLELPGQNVPLDLAEGQRMEINLK